jgi:hypothetical protein
LHLLSVAIVSGLLKAFGTGGSAIAVMIYPREVAQAAGKILSLAPGTLQMYVFHLVLYRKKRLMYFPERIVLFPSILSSIVCMIW